jgi:hypothetical protein
MNDATDNDLVGSATNKRKKKVSMTLDSEMVRKINAMVDGFELRNL